VNGKGSLLSWLIPTLGYAVTVGLTGISVKYALKTITWQQMLLWVPLAYACWAAVLIVGFGARLPLGVGGAWAALTALFASGGLILLFISLDRGQASVVVPVSSIYPVVTLIASAAFLSESITVPKVIGTVLVVAGVTVISR
jgi:transporter family protein